MSNWTADDIDLVAESGRYHRDRRWDALTLRIWQEGTAAAFQLDGLIDEWSDWVSGLPCEGPFDWMSWAPWMYWPQNPLLPPAPLPQFPWTPGLFQPPHGALIFDTTPLDHSRWTLRNQDDRYAHHVATQKLLAECLDDPDLRIAWRRDPIGCTKDDAGEVCFCDDVRECGNTYPRAVTKPATAADAGEPLPPDTNHGGDRIPGRYA